MTRLSGLQLRLRQSIVSLPEGWAGIDLLPRELDNHPNKGVSTQGNKDRGKDNLVGQDYSVLQLPQRAAVYQSSAGNAKTIKETRLKYKIHKIECVQLLISFKVSKVLLINNLI
ncbi:hypothetical protein [Nitrosomonas sp.]|uniref:hypothetical protein n=1 Tax=Nitrosomonas sp. TaxID=42353 RepID=UPI0025E77123|nr:hypothetical protein [Nitrosomonas sp.]